MADSDGEVRGLALDLLFEGFDDEFKLDEEFNGEIEEAMYFCFHHPISQYVCIRK